MDHDDAVRMLKAIARAFDDHDLDGIMAYFADDAVFEAPRGTDPWGTRFMGIGGGPRGVRRAFLRNPRHPLSAG